MRNLTKLIAVVLVCFAAYGCNSAKTDDEKSKELMRDSVPNDTTTIQYRDTTSAQSRGEIPPTPQPDTSTTR